jgi:Dynamin family
MSESLVNSKTNNITEKISEYEIWRSNLTKTICHYRDWLATSPYSDSVQELRLYDMLEMLGRDQIVVAFLAEFSRGKSETINALFFSDFNQRLLPSEPGLSSMCTSEIFWDSRAEPSISLLPIETRLRDDSLTYLKTTPTAWIKFKLDVYSPDQIKEMLRKLIDLKEITKAEAEDLGLFDSHDKSMLNQLATTGYVKVPQWRHAIINFPHPLLKSGLVIIDIPGLCSLDNEPELALNIIPNAHAVLYLTSTDSGITMADMQVWNDFIKGRAKNTLTLVNKIDLLWDDYKPKQHIANDIAKRINITAHQLGIAPEGVIAVSAQKALIAKIKNDETLLQRSGFLELETTLGNQIINAKQEVLGHAVIGECTEMIKGSRKLVQHRLMNLRSQISELYELRGLKEDSAKQVLAKVVADKKRYEASIPTFNLAHEKISQLGKQLLRHLSADYLNSSLAESRKAMGDSWTTVGLNKGMRSLMKQANELAKHITNESKAIKRLADNIYDVFQTKHDFDLFEPPTLDMSNFLKNMKALEKITDDFCADPINVLTEKHFLIRRFFLGLGTQMQKIFAQAEKDCEHWQQNVLSELISQMSEHKTSLDERVKNLIEAKSSKEALDAQLATVEKEYADITKEGQSLDMMLLHLIKAVKLPKKPKINVQKPINLNKTMNLPEIPFINVSS